MKDKGKATIVARIADDLLGEVDRIRLPDLRQAMSERMVCGEGKHGNEARQRVRHDRQLARR